MSQAYVDFRVIKSSITMEGVLHHYSINLRKINHNSLRGACPLPSHSSEASKNTFSVHTEKNIWACQSNSCASARGGKKGGNIIDFVSAMEWCSVHEAAVKLNEWFISNVTKETAEKGREETQSTTPREPETSANKTNAPLAFTLQGVTHDHGYVVSRGLTEETSRHFGVGFFSGRGSMSGRVVIPIHNSGGDLVAYAGRSVDEQDPKYKFPGGFQKSHEVWNLHRVLALDSRRNVVIVVEGFFDCMKVHQVGVPHVVALMGSSMSERQEQLLCEFRHVILFLDGDDAGRAASELIAARLVHQTFVKIIGLDKGLQPDQLSSEEIKTYLRVNG